MKFHWDRRNEADDNSSCWLRVSQDWAGIGFGSFMLPRVGQEVLVAFYEGDPDHPVVVGRVYNETNPVPYKLPKHRTRSTWKTDSSPNSTGFSELMFEDKDKHELVYLQAQKDMQKLVKNYETERTFSNRLTVVGEQRQTVVGLLDATMVGDNYLLELIEPPSKGALGILGQEDPQITTTDTKIEMRDERIIFTTGKATVAFDGKNIRFDADGDITIRSEKKDVILEGKMMFINTIPARPAPKPGAPVPPTQGSEDLDHLYDEAAKAAVALAGAALKIARDIGGRAIIPMTPTSTMIPAECPIGAGFYSCREKDFYRRHPGAPPPSAPDYYMGYGDKYYKRFHEYGPGDLTPEGLAWMERTGVALQEGIDARRIADPMEFARLEEDNDAFRKFAYDGHPDAYVDSGLLDLPLQDLQKIGRTPDVSDLLSKDGLAQVWEVTKKMKPSDYANITKSTAKKAASDAGKAISNAWAGVKSWF